MHLIHTRFKYLKTPTPTSPAVKSITKFNTKSNTSKVHERKAIGEKGLISRFY